MTEAERNRLLDIFALGQDLGRLMERRRRSKTPQGLGRANAAIRRTVEQARALGVELELEPEELEKPSGGGS